MKITNFIIAICISASIVAQPTQITNRLELSDKQVEYHSCVPFGQNGFLLKSLDHQQQNVKKNYVYTYEKFDTSFQKLTQANVVIPSRKATYIDFTDKNRHFNLAVQTNGNFRISIVTFATMEVKTIQGKLPKNVSISDLRATKNHIYMFGFTHEMPILFIQNIETGESSFGKIVPINKRFFSLLSFEINEETDELYLFTRDSKKFDNIIKFYIYKNGIKQSETILLSPDPEKYLTSAYALRLSNGTCIITGTYSNINRHNDASVGLFVMTQEAPNTITFCKYINYLDINDFTSYLSERQQERIEKRKERKKANNNELELDFHIIPHKILENNGESTLICEAYYPTFRTECYSFTGVYNTIQTQCYQVFDGFQYTHYFLIHFDKDGNILWSNGTPMYIDFKPHSVIRNLSINQKNQQVQTIYSSWDKIFVHTYVDGIEQHKEEIPLISENEKLITSSSKNRYWFDNNFLLYGSQKILDKDIREKRTIFFVEKIKISEN